MTENPSGNITSNVTNITANEKDLLSLGQTLVWGRLSSLGFKVT